MQKLKVVIVDDEPIAIEILQTYMKKISDAEVIGTCSNALEAFALLNKQQVDLLLLDINMPEITGMDFLRTLKNPPMVIFTTAYSEYAVESYELNAIDYLLKPVSFERFLKAISKALSLPAADQKNTGPAVNFPADKLLFVRAEGKWIRIDLGKLYIVEGLKDYIRLWMDDGRITVHSTMKNFEEQLQAYPNFLRVHKSFIINLDYVSEVEGSAVKVKDQQVAIGNTYRDAVQKVLNAYKLI